MEDPRLVAANAIALAVTLIVLFTLRPRALRLGLVDRPSARKRHRGAVPLIGGLSFFIGTIVAMLYLRQPDPFLMALLPAAALICVIGVIDDLKDLSVKLRLLVQGLASVAVVLASGVYINDLGPLFGSQTIRLGMLGIPLTIVAVVALINAFNMLDGIDGLAGSISMLTIAAIMAFVGPGWESVGVILLLQVVFTSLVPYMLVNMGWPDGRKIFMGDAGSTLIGFMLAWCMIYLSQRGVGHFRTVDMLWCAALPIMEMPSVMFRRMRRGLSPFKPDRRHLHHMLLDIGLSPRKALAVISASAAGLMLVGYLLKDVQPLVSVGVFCGLALSYLFATRESLDWLIIHRSRPESSIGRSAHADHPEVRRSAFDANHGVVAAGASSQRIPERDASLRILCVVNGMDDALALAPLVDCFRNDDRFDPVICLGGQSANELERISALFDKRIERMIEMGPSGGATPPEAVDARIDNVVLETRPDLIMLFSDTLVSERVVAAAERHGIATTRLIHESRSKLPFHADSVTLELASRRAARGGAEQAIRSVQMIASDMAVATLDHVLDRMAEQPALKSGMLTRLGGVTGAGRCVLVAGVDAEYQGIAGQGIREAAQRWPDVNFLVHGDGFAWVEHGPHPDNIHQLRDLDYLDYASLLEASQLVVTDCQEIKNDATHIARAYIPVQDLMVAAQSSAADGGNVVSENLIAVLGNPALAEALVGTRRSMALDQDNCDRLIGWLLLLQHARQQDDERPSVQGAKPLTRAA